jgi:hypothetical protein
MYSHYHIDSQHGTGILGCTKANDSCQEMVVSLGRNAAAGARVFSVQKYRCLRRKLSAHEAAEEATGRHLKVGTSNLLADYFLPGSILPDVADLASFPVE